MLFTGDAGVHGFRTPRTSSRVSRGRAGCQSGGGGLWRRRRRGAPTSPTPRLQPEQIAASFWRRPIIRCVNKNMQLRAAAVEAELRALKAPDGTEPSTGNTMTSISRDPAFLPW